jgi:hypothetical protein
MFNCIIGAMLRGDGSSFDAGTRSRTSNAEVVDTEVLARTAEAATEVLLTAQADARR